MLEAYAAVKGWQGAKREASSHLPGLRLLRPSWCIVEGWRTSQLCHADRRRVHRVSPHAARAPACSLAYRVRPRPSSCRRPAVVARARPSLLSLSLPSLTASPTLARVSSSLVPPARAAPSARVVSSSRMSPPVVASSTRCRHLQRALWRLRPCAAPHPVRTSNATASP